MQKNEIILTYGNSPFDMAQDILRAAHVEDLIGSKDKRIGLKPNLVVPKPASEGATTHPEILAGIIEYLLGHGFQDITIMEGSWVGERTARAFDACGYSGLARKYGVRLLDLQKDSASARPCAGLNIRICDAALAMDFMINLPVLKGHCQTGVTCALKNNKGVLPDSEKRRFHTMGLHKPIAHLNTVAKSDFILVDGICGDLDFEEGGNPVPMNRMFGVRDAVLCDAFACRLMGIAVEDVPYIGLAERLGVGSADLHAAVVTELNSPQCKGAKPERSGRSVAKLAKYVEQRDACSACYGSLIHALARLDEQGLLRNLKPGGICIGQGFKGERDITGRIGIGACLRQCGDALPGCPPTAADILAFLMRHAR